MRLCMPWASFTSGAESSGTSESLRMPWDEDCRTAGLGKTERPVGWEGNGEPARMTSEALQQGKPAETDRRPLKSLSHSFTLDLVILVDALPRHDWLVAAVTQRLREEIRKLRVEINEEKSRIVDLRKGESFGFLGFDFRLVRSLKGTWRPQYTPKLKKRTAVLAKVREIFRRNKSQPVGKVIELINPILRGWVNYFAVGHSSRCFTFIQDWVEKKI